MISSKQWDSIMSFTKYGDAIRDSNTYVTSYYEYPYEDHDGFWSASSADLSGSAYTTDSTKYDVSKNIYDLAGNLHEWTLTGHGDSYRVYCFFKG